MKRKEILYKVVSFINREELGYLDEISKDIYFSKGKRTARAKVIEKITKLSRNSLNLKRSIAETAE